MSASDHRKSIQQAMRAAFPVAEARVAQFYAMQEYHLGWRDIDLQPAAHDSGKLLRPLLVLLACQAVGGNTEQALPLAAGIQLIHDFSLIHDDIEDNSATRRGRITVWKQWGLAQGINTGDGMFVVAHLALHRLTETGLPASVVLEVLRRFDQTILTICEGQFLDLSYEGDLTIDEADYLAMISRKTAALVAAATGLGAMVGGAPAEQAAALFDFGQNLGLAFQVQDDILGVWGDPARTGKPYAADLWQRKLNLPVVHALRHSAEQDALADRYQRTQITETDVTAMLAWLDTAGSRHYAEGVAHHYYQAAVAALDQIRPDNSAALAAVAELRAMAAGLLQREA
jgi:geranylgeranyl diphosphate synthase type I